MSARTGWGGTRLMGSEMSAASSQMAGGAGSVGPSAFEYAQGFFPGAEGMIEQAWGQLNQAASAGLPSEQQQIHALTLQKLESVLQDLHDQASKFCTASGCLGSEPGFSNWRYKGIEPLTQQIQAELAALVALNQGAVRGQAYTGLLWGLGIATTVAVAGFLVWRQKGRHRG
jgi:hypothetical protein